MTRRSSAQVQKPAGLFSNWASRAFHSKKRGDLRRSPLRAGSAQLESLEVRVLLTAQSNDNQSNDNNQVNGTYSVGHDPNTGVTTTYDDRAYWDNYVNDLLSGGVAANFTMRDLIQQLNPPGAGNNNGPQGTVLGNDDRTRVTDTFSWPSRAVVKMYMQFSNGSYIGSGAMISPYHVLTAGHVVYDTGLNQWAQSIKVNPGQDGALDDATGNGRWYGEANMTYMWSNTGWTVSEDWQHDWGVVTLDRRIGDNTGWFGWQWYAADSAFNGLQVATQGYPGDLQGGEYQYRATGPTSSATPLKVWYGGTLDTFGGQSGSGVWQDFGNGDYRVVVVHAYGDDGSGRNSGTRMTQARWDQLFNSFIATDNSVRAPTDRPDLVNWDDWFGTNLSSLSTTSINVGDNLTSNIYTRNNGTASAGAFTVRFRLSTDATYQTTDTLLGDVTINSLGEFAWTSTTLTAAIPNVAAGTYRVVYSIDAFGTQVEFNESNNTGAIGTVLNVLPADNNDQISEAGLWFRSQMNAVFTGNSIAFAGDVNMHAFTAYAGERFGIDLDRPSGTLDSRLRLFDALGNELANNDDGAAPGEGGSTESYIDFTFATTGTYYLGVSYYQNNQQYNPVTGNGDYIAAFGTGAYNITFTILNPDTDDQISEATQWTRSVIGTTTATAQISIPSDVDMYRIQVVAGETFGFDLDRPSGSLDSVLRLFNASGTQLAFNDDGAGPGEGGSLESYITYTFTTSGLYYLGVSSYQNWNYNAGTGAGDTFSATSTGDYTLTVLNIDYDDQISEAIGATIGATAAGVIDGGLDVDTYAITVTAGQRVYFDIDRNGGSLDSRLRLFDAAGVQLANNDDAAGPGNEFSNLESYLEYTFVTAGTYYISVSYFLNNTGYSPVTGDGDYTPIVSAVGAYNLNIGFVNQAPVITAATGPAYTFWNDYAYFYGANAFSISDVDAYSGIVEATLTGTNTTVSLFQTTGLTFSVGDGTDDDTMTFTGTIADINAALNGMSAYTGSIGFATSSIALSVNDLGNSGIGGAKTASSNVEWYNTIGDFGVAGAGIMQLYGLQTNETSVISVVNGTVVGNINGTNYDTGVAAVDVTQIWIYMRGGDDSFTVDASAAGLNITYINAGGGSDVVNAIQLTNDIIYGIYGDGGYDSIYGGQGNDIIYLSYYDGGYADGQGGNDTMYGTSLVDTIYGGAGDDYILAYAGDDYINGGDGFNQIYGMEGNDLIYAGADASLIYGGSENDYISVGNGGNTIYGEEGNDTIIAGGGNDYIDAGSGFDSIDAGAGSDTVLGGADGDTIYGGDGNDVLYGGTGNDQYTFDASIAQGSDQVFEYANEGTDLLDFYATSSAVNLNIDLRSTATRVLSAGLTLQLNLGNTFENVWGGSGNDTIIGNAANNGLWGSAGNDQYFGFQGNDDYYGSEGNDTYNFDADSQLNTDRFLDVDNGIDTINLFATTTLGTTLNLGLFNVNQAVNGNLSLNIRDDVVIENILGTDLVDNYTGNAADNQFDLRGGDDIAVGLAGNDRFIGGAGNDTLTGGNNNDTYVFDGDIAQGTDTLVESTSLAGGVDTLDFSLTNLTTSNLAIDLRTVGVQAVRAGFVSLSLGASNNFENAIAGAGNDNVFGNNLANSLWGWGGNDLIYGFNANDNLDGGLGNDSYMFDADSNIGSDTVTDAGGTDTLNWLLTTTGSGVTIDLASTAAQNLFASGFHTLTLTAGDSIENVIGTNQADNIRGNALNNVITANGGDDLLEGRAGNDTLVGGAGSDQYIFNADNVLGADLLNETGGGSFDILNFFDTQVTNLNIDLRIAGYQTIAAGNLSISLQNATAYETVYGGQANDRIIGSTINNFLYGYAGNDIIYGQGGNDVIYGDEGNDTLVGEAGRDLIVGGNGADIINGGTEADLIIGGTTSYDFNVSNQSTIISIWAGAGTYAARAAAVQAGAVPLNNLTVFNDGAIDQLRGGTGTTDDQLDLFFSSALDTLPDFGTGLELNVVI